MKLKLSFGIFVVLAGGIIMLKNAQTNIEKATFAGGCFWCMEAAFEKLPGVQEVISGYIGGTQPNPTYQDYAQKGYIEAIEIKYHPSQISYTTLLEHFWHQINPTDAGGQFVDRGPQYRSAIFYHTDAQKIMAEASKDQLQKSGLFSEPIVTEIIKAGPFYKAEEYHQDYYKNHPWKYSWYRAGSGRDQFLEKTWKPVIKKLTNDFKKPSDEQLRKKLTPIQYEVTQKNGTEQPFKNEYWDNKKTGIYVDIVSGEPLFSSLDKFDSKTGWPSFTKPLVPENIIQKEDKGWFTTRIEIRSQHADSHLGHLFNDGPPPSGLRYCMNSAALRFVPVESLEMQGYGEYKKLFAKL